MSVCVCVCVLYVCVCAVYVCVCVRILVNTAKQRNSSIHHIKNEVIMAIQCYLACYKPSQLLKTLIV